MPRDHKFDLDVNWLHYNQIRITGTFGCTPSRMHEAAKIAAQKSVDLSALVTHHYPLSEIEQAFATTENYHGLRAVSYQINLHCIFT